MRSQLVSWVFLVCMGVGTTIVACSDAEVRLPENEGGGTSGSGGATSSSTTTTSTTSTTTTTSTTSTTTTTSTGGGGDVCEQACAYASSCGVPACQFFQLNCADPQAECGAQCLLDATCDQIGSLLSQSMDQVLVGCISACQDSGAGGAGGGSGATPQECAICAVQSRCLPSCGGDEECQGWQGCIQRCFQEDPQPTCFRTCDAGFPGAEADYQAAYACACMSCGSTCAAFVDPCNAAP